MTTVSTPEGIAAFQLLSLRGALKLERVGLKGRNGALRPKWAAHLGLKPRDSYEVFIERIEELLNLASTPAASERTN